MEAVTGTPPSAIVRTNAGGRLGFGRPTGFARLWFGQAVSVAGTQVTFLALPMAAVIALHATPAQMGLLGALDNLPYLLFGLGVGLVVDRWRRRRLMIIGDLVRAAAVGSVPLAAAAGRLTYEQLLAVVFVVGVCNLLFDIASQAQLPDLVAADRLVEANGRLELNRSLSMVGGPAVAGTLISWLTAPIAIAVDAISYLVSAGSIASIREPEPHRTRSEESARAQILDGLRLVAADRRLVGIAGASAIVSFAMNAMFAVLVYFLANERHMDASAIGVLFTVFGLGGAAGALLSPTIGRHLGVGRVLVLAPAIAGLSVIGFTLAPGTGSPFELGLAIPVAMLGVGMVGYGVTCAGVRQQLAPADARGRVMGTLRFFEWGTMPLGSLAGGLAGQALGPGAALGMTAAAFLLAGLWVAASPAARLGRATTRGNADRSVA
jgi:predicted MFS family arabinose efflux permease